MPLMTLKTYDALIIGSGIAGNLCAITLAEAGLKVALITKKRLTDASTTWAQGGIAAVLDPLDNFDAHIADTLKAGAGLNNKAVVEEIIQAAPQAIEKLITLDTSFTPYKADDARYSYHLTKEGGHSRRRILHDSDHTGQSIETALIRRIKHLNIPYFENHLAFQILKGQGNRCHGIYAIREADNSVVSFSAPNIVLATGGANRVYLYTTNPDTITGDGIAMAFRAGLPIVNMEFIQFHPTCLYHPQDRSFLLSEAMRGEGGILRNPLGEAFMEKYTPQKDLAPRDVVARAIDAEMKKGGFDHVYLDVTHLDNDYILAHFPTIFQRLFDLGIDIRTQMIPVVPAAHYTCGGIEAKVNGQTAIEGLYAIGETAHTGFHGANRLASNSLLEGAVMALKSAQHILTHYEKKSCQLEAPKDWDASQVTPESEKIFINHNWDELRRVMWDLVGIVRSNKRLAQAKKRLDLIRSEVEDYYAHHTISTDFMELRNLITVAQLIVYSAQQRTESRGLHYNKDYPHTAPQAQNTRVLAGDFTSMG